MARLIGYARVSTNGQTFGRQCADAAYSRSYAGGARQADVGPWLSGAAGTELLKPVAEDRLRMWPVSRRVNKTGTGDDDPLLIDEVAA